MRALHVLYYKSEYIGFVPILETSRQASFDFYCDLATILLAKQTACKAL